MNERLDANYPMDILPQFYGYGQISQKQVEMKRKLLDNNLRLSAPIADFIRLEPIEGRTGEKKQYNLIAHHFYPCKWPKLEKKPFTRLYLKGIDESKCIDQKIVIVDTYGKNADGQKESSILVRIPYNSDIQKGDLVMRAFIDGDYANIITYEVIDFEGNFSDTSALTLHAKLGASTIEFGPESILYKNIIQMANTRAKVGY